MKDEIERRFITTDTSWRQKALANDAVQIIQGYPINLQEQNLAVRVRKTTTFDRDVTYTLGRKTKGTDLVTPEHEIEIGKSDWETFISQCGSQVLEKLRWKVPLGNNLYVEVDTFTRIRNKETSLVISEVEFKTEDSARSFHPPEWLGVEITGQHQWSNQSLCLYGIPEKSLAQKEIA